MELQKRMLFVLLLVGILLVSVSSLSGKTAYAASISPSHGVIHAETMVNDHLKLVSSTVIPAPTNIKRFRPIPPPSDCITLWGAADSLKKSGVVASYNVKANLWNTCGTALYASTNGVSIVIDIQCEGVWIEQTGLGGNLPALANNQQLLPLFYFHFYSSCVAADGVASLPQHISVPVLADAIRVDNDQDANGGVDITVY